MNMTVLTTKHYTYTKPYHTDYGHFVMGKKVLNMCL